MPEIETQPISAAERRYAERLSGEMKRFRFVLKKAAAARRKRDMKRGRLRDEGADPWEMDCLLDAFAAILTAISEAKGEICAGGEGDERALAKKIAKRLIAAIMRAPESADLCRLTGQEAEPAEIARYLVKSAARAAGTAYPELSLSEWRRKCEAKTSAALNSGAAGAAPY